MIKAVKKSQPTSIHPTAIISSGASLANDVVVGPYAVIADNVEIASGTEIGAHAVLTGPARIGHNNKIYPHAAIGGDSQDKKYVADSESLLVIGDNNTIREFTTINRGDNNEGWTEIGNDNWIMAYVHIAHACRIGDNNIFANNTTLAGHIEVQNNVNFAGFAKILQYCRVGSHAFIGFDCGVNRDVPPFVTVAGYDAEPKGINTIGLQRSGFSEQEIVNIKRAYKTIYRQGLKLQEAIEQLQKDVKQAPELEPLVMFLQTAKRSITR